jgi:hypothetical protein
MENRNARTRQTSDGDIGAVGSTTEPPARGPAVRGTFLRAAVVVGIFARSLQASAAGLDAVESPAIVSSTPASAPALAPREQVRVQPRAWEFAPPYGRSDLSPERARTVDELYIELMRSVAPKGTEESSATHSTAVRSSR